LGFKSSDLWLIIQNDFAQTFPLYSYEATKILPICCFELAIFILILPRVGALAQLARAFDWQSRGHRFDSDMLHSEGQRVAPPVADAALFHLSEPLCTRVTPVKERFTLSALNIQLIF
jgi:hypothetical protein